jgi:hypothetical protein
MCRNFARNKNKNIRDQHATSTYNRIKEALHVRITREIKQKTPALKFNLISGFHCITGFKAEVRAGLMKKEGQLTTIALIKAEAMQIELILKEKKKKSTIFTNGCTNGNTKGNNKEVVLINKIEEEKLDDFNFAMKNG